MALEDIVKKITEGYVNWCKEDAIDLTKDNIKYFTSVINDNLKELYQKQKPGTLMLNGELSHRTTDIEFSIINNMGIVTAWGNTYTVSLEEIKELKNETIVYDQEEQEKVWIRSIYLTPDGMSLGKDIYEKFFVEDNSKERDA